VGTRPRFALQSAGKALSVTVSDDSAPTMGARRIDRIRKALEREFHLEVKSG
jgi:hypothetical protein